LNATDLADYLVRRGLEFRRAHEVVGRAVGYAIEQGKALEELSLDEFQQLSPLFADDLYAALKLESSLANRPARGGTSPLRVAEAIARAKAELS
jgi:argininosuccinate lyase